ncbi:hypothetical protein BU090_02290 [Staphylococcus warneri]|nr:hypothetical protein [Staphylococcus warneri]PTI19861.1 hypothetical protein BU082_07775 [Staphylococcus warneri]PTI21920.1 hypothetical protein BU081_11515 [Staphylococcus warneri]PTI61424.1 hypothetical protein BU090_02290 [Staphylococcus warneri]RIN00493.1 hypothetical protein BU093_00930 [Staphylococcus warneri]RIN07265.1 hypothetical protein BU092_00610 [Staphylococcus warneri]
MKFVVLLIVCVLTLVGYLIGTQKSKHEVNQRNEKIEQLKQKQISTQETNKRLKETVHRQNKTVIAEDEKRIREIADSFVKNMFTMEKGKSFKSKEKAIKPLLTEDYYDKLFGDSRDKYNMYDDISVSDVHVYFDTYDPKKNDYKVFVQFEETTSSDDSDKIEHKKTSVQLDLVRTNDEWKIDELRRFNLQPRGD